jgi:hypothetical protein
VRKWHCERVLLVGVGVTVAEPAGAAELAAGVEASRSEVFTLPVSFLFFKTTKKGMHFGTDPEAPGRVRRHGGSHPRGRGAVAAAASARSWQSVSHSINQAQAKVAAAQARLSAAEVVANSDSLAAPGAHKAVEMALALGTAPQSQVNALQEEYVSDQASGPLSSTLRGLAPVARSSVSAERWRARFPSRRLGRGHAMNQCSFR